MNLRRNTLRSLEAVGIGFLLIQSIRYLYATLYAHLSSADLVQRVGLENVRDLPGVVDPAEVEREVIAVAATLLAPLIGLVAWRTRWTIPLAVALCVVARALTLQLDVYESVLAESVVVAAALLYMTVIAIRRPRFFPTIVAGGVAVDMLIRAFNDTADPTFNPDFQFTLAGQFDLTMESAMYGFAFIMLLVTLLATLAEREESRQPGYEPPRRGVFSVWGALALGGILHLELTLLGLPNAVSRWAELDYYLTLPFVLTATLFVLVPEVRAQSARFIGIFDGQYRGWMWVLLLSLLIILGNRFGGVVAVITLSLAQFFTLMALWWLIKQPEKAPPVNPTPILILLGLIVFVVLSTGDYFTYNYAYVRPLEPPFDILESLLRGMRDLGIVLILLAAVFACLPMILERRVVPWRGGRMIDTVLSLGLVLIVTVGAARAAIPDPVRRPLDVNCLRIGSLNLHGGYTTYYADNLAQTRDLILRSGADIVLLQEVEAGLLASGSVDQPLWLANQLDMNAVFFPQNEQLQGIAVLSRLSVNSTEGILLTSPGTQAAAQYVRYDLDDTGDLHIYNAWLSFPQAGDDGILLPERQQDHTVQMNELYSVIANNHFATDAAQASPDRVVLGGSFNAPESTRLYTIWEETIFEDPFATLFQERRNTLFPAGGDATRWDYLWLLNLQNSGQLIAPDPVSNRRLSLVAVGREANQFCPTAAD